jgi:hypothetical protein
VAGSGVALPYQLQHLLQPPDRHFRFHVQVAGVERLLADLGEQLQHAGP